MAQETGTLLSVEGTTGQTALKVLSGETELQNSLSVNAGETYLGRKLGPGGTCQGAVRSSCPVFEVRMRLLQILQALKPGLVPCKSPFGLQALEIQLSQHATCFRQLCLFALQRRFLVAR